MERQAGWVTAAGPVAIGRRPLFREASDLSESRGATPRGSGASAFGSIFGSDFRHLALFVRKYPKGDLPRLPSRCTIKLAYQAADASLQIPGRASSPLNQETSPHSSDCSASGEFSPFGKASPEGMTGGRWKRLAGLSPLRES
jgi:hypothetical protein